MLASLCGAKVALKDKEVELPFSFRFSSKTAQCEGMSDDELEKKAIEQFYTELKDGENMEDEAKAF